MKAVVQDRYGPPEVLHIEEIEPPVPRSDEILVRVRASTVSQSDTHMRAPDPVLWRLILGLRRPRRRVLGVEFAGEVEAVGRDVSEFSVGDAVFGQPSSWSGTHQELVCTRASAPIAHKPSGMSFEEAAAVCDGAAQALSALRAADAGPGRHIAIYGASGALGTAGVQLARHFGARVTAICGTAHVELVRSLGPDEVIDYRREDFAMGGPRFDAIIDAVGKYSFLRARPALKPRGVFVATDGLGILVWPLLTRVVGTRRFRVAASRRNKADVILVKQLIEAGAFRAVVDRRYPMAEVVEAHRYVESWHKGGNVVLTIP